MYVKKRAVRNAACFCHNPEGISPKNRVWYENKTCIGCGICEICNFIKTLPENTVDRWELCAFNNSCNHKYKKLGLDWNLKDSPLIAKEKMDSFLKIARESGAKEVISSGIMK